MSDVVPPKILAALKLVLLFHSGEAWTPERTAEWIDHIRTIEIATGRGLGEKINGGEIVFAGEITTRALCDAIRAVLGEA